MSLFKEVCSTNQGFILLHGVILSYFYASIDTFWIFLMLACGIVMSSYFMRRLIRGFFGG